jgi:hypothetical protein
MNKLKCIATPLIAVAMMTVPMMAQAQSSEAGNATQNYNANDRAYQDGVQAAKLDAAAKRPIDPAKSYLYVHPPVKGDARDKYRSEFTVAYQSAAKQLSSQSGQ